MHNEHFNYIFIKLTWNETAVDEFAGKEGMSSGMDPMINKEVNQFVDKEL